MGMSFEEIANAVVGIEEVGRTAGGVKVRVRFTMIAVDPRVLSPDWVGLVPVGERPVRRPQPSDEPKGVQRPSRASR
jgi:hypothetical protein